VYRRFFSDVLFSISCRFPFVGLLGVLILSLLSFRLVFSFPVLFVFVHLMSDPSVEKLVESCSRRLKIAYKQKHPTPLEIPMVMLQFSTIT